MRTDQVFPRSNVVQFFTDVWKNRNERRARLVEFDNCDSAEMQRIAQDLGTSVSEMRVLAGCDKNAADVLRGRLNSLNLDPATIEPAVMRDLQRCCSQCGSKTLCVHELEDRPKEASWPKYCPNEQTISASPSCSPPSQLPPKWISRSSTSWASSSSSA
jgi:hypothetical protein